MTVSGLTTIRVLRQFGQRRTRATHKSRSHTRSRTRLRLLRWRTASWCRSARISNWSEARVRSVEANPASSDISTAHMAHDGISAESQVQHFQLLDSFQYAQIDPGFLRGKSKANFTGVGGASGN